MPFGGIFGRRRGSSSNDPDRDEYGRQRKRTSERRQRRDPSQDASWQQGRFPQPDDDPRRQQDPRGGRAPGGRGAPRMTAGKMKLILALVVAGIAFFSYWKNTQINPVTGEKQRITMTLEQEVALGLQAAPQMIQQHQGVYSDPYDRERVEAIGQRLVRASDLARRSGYDFKFTLLADPRTVNAFALPGGQIFMTYALYGQLRSEGEIAGVLGHEIGHVVGRHGAEHMAKGKLMQGLSGAAVIATWDPSNPNSAQKGAIAAMVLKMINMKYGREDELESDALGVNYMAEAGYDPHALLGVMDVLEKAAGSGKRPPEFMSTHPNPGRRRDTIKEAIQKRFPAEMPEGLIK